MALPFQECQILQIFIQIEKVLPTKTKYLQEIINEKKKINGLFMK